MIDITEEEIARAILHEEYGCAPEDVPNLYGKARATARLVMALVQPALERARRDGLHRQTKALAQAQVFRRLYEEGLRVVSLYGGHDKMTDTERLGAIANHPHFAAAIRKDEP